MNMIYKSEPWGRHQIETFSALLALCVGYSPVLAVNNPRKSKRLGASMFSLIRAWTNGSVSNRYAGGFRRHHAHYDVTVMQSINEGDAM